MCTEYLMMQCGVHVIKDELLNYCVDDVMYEYCAHYRCFVLTCSGQLMTFLLSTWLTKMAAMATVDIPSVDSDTSDTDCEIPGPSKKARSGAGTTKRTNLIPLSVK